MNKILLIVCTVVIVLAIAVPSTILIMNKVNENNQPEVTGAGFTMMDKITADTTFEEYSKDFKDDVTDEQIEEAETIFNQLQQAIADDDTDTMRSLMMQLNQLGLFENSENMPGMGQKPAGDGNFAGQGDGQRPNRN